MVKDITYKWRDRILGHSKQGIKNTSPRELTTFDRT
jgi:hypothetical protein